MPERIFQLVVGFCDDKRKVGLAQDGSAEDLVAQRNSPCCEGKNILLDDIEQARRYSIFCQGIFLFDECSVFEHSAAKIAEKMHRFGRNCVDLQQRAVFDGPVAFPPNQCLPSNKNLLQYSKRISVPSILLGDRTYYEHA